jgi:N-formylglutamate amidohydrolase
MPARRAMPFVFCSPHSGRIYPRSFLAVSRLDPLTLRRSEDAFIDEIFASAPRWGAPLLRAHFPRAYLDLNREPWELDPAMFQGDLPAFVNNYSARVAAGLGTIARLVAYEADIYREKLPFAEAEFRIRTFYEPFHEKLQGLLEETHRRYGFAVLIDCHSMPSIGGFFDQDSGLSRADIVLGDRFGSSCTPALTSFVTETLERENLRVVRNLPYAGGFITEHYGRPADGFHVLQIEINRGLYMDERKVTRSSGLSHVARAVSNLVQALRSMDINPLAAAAE